MKLKHLALIIASSLIVNVAHASVIAIDFDDGAGADGDAIGNHYSGVTFSSNAMWASNGGLTGSSGTLGLGSSDQRWMYSSDSDLLLRATFDSLISSISITAIDLGANGFRIEGFDDNGQSLGFAEKFGVGFGIGNFDTVTFAHSNIKSVAFYQPVQGFGDGIILDNLTYVTAPVPEPESFVLMGTGLMVMLATRRRKSKKI